LLAAGRRLFGEKGLYESRIEDLTSEAGIAKGTLYGYYSNKEELIHAVVVGGFGELFEHVRTAAQGGRSHADLIARVVRAHVDFFAENPDLMRVFHQVRGMLKFDRPEWRPLRIALSDYLMELADVLRVPGGKGVPALGDRQDVARILFGAVSGVTSVRAALSPGRTRPIVPEAVTRAIVAMVMTYEAECGAKSGRSARQTRPRTRPPSVPGTPGRPRGRAPLARGRARMNGPGDGASTP
jgi:TetR/AcrR family fatty acid metabolism transcriptional regulator